MELPATTERVTQHTPEHINQQLRLEMERRLHYYAENPAQIDARLGELDEEWDIERALQANAGSLALMGLILGATGARRYYLLSFGVMAFLLQHALEGWCPPLRLLRRLGYRTRREIETERYALKLLRGDFGSEAAAGASVTERVGRALQLAES